MGGIASVKLIHVILDWTLNGMLHRRLIAFFN
jgi:hypothetical protein